MFEGEVWELRQAAEAVLLVLDASFAVERDTAAANRLQRAVDAMNFSEAVDKARLRDAAP
jgi:hypothetical protein